MIVSLLYKVTRRLLSVPAVLLRGGTAKDTELLVLRHENAALRRQLTGPVRYEPADRLWFAALAALVDRHRCREVFPVTPGTLLTWHRKLIARKWDYCAARKVIVAGRARLSRSWEHVRVSVSLLYRVTRRLLSIPSVLLRCEATKDAELLVLRHENAVLRRQLTGPVHYEPADRFWFAALSALVDRRRWREVFPVTPGTLLAWNRKLMAPKWDYSARRPTGRPPTRVAVKTLVLRLARENPRWGHRRIQGEPARLGHHIAHSTVWRILHDAGIDPAPRRGGPIWRQLLTAQAQGVIAADFLHLDTMLGKRLYALVFLEHGTRRLHVTDVTSHPTREWTTQQARNLAADLGTRMESLRFLLRDRDGKYSHAFDTVFLTDELRVIKSAPQAPRMNAHCERVIGTLRRELLDHILIMGETHAHQVLKTYEDHYNRHRPHQARDQLPPEARQHPAAVHNLDIRRLQRTRVLGGLINEYRHAA